MFLMLFFFCETTTNVFFVKPSTDDADTHNTHAGVSLSTDTSSTTKRIKPLNLETNAEKIGTPAPC
jgi:hypothetical protein